MDSAVAAEKTASHGLSRLLTVDEPVTPERWLENRAREVCRDLESGHIVFLPHTPIDLPYKDRALLLDRKQSSSAYHKNIAYRPLEDRVTGLDRSEEQEAEELRAVLADYSKRSLEFLKVFLAP